MSGAVFKSTRGGFNRKNQSFMSLLMSRMALDIERIAKTSAGMPVKTGAMKSSTMTQQLPGGKWRVIVNKQYASYQERGARADGSHVIKNYTTSGTSSGFFTRAIGVVIKNKLQYVEEARRAFNQ